MHRLFIGIKNTLLCLVELINFIVFYNVPIYWGKKPQLSKGSSTYCVNDMVTSSGSAVLVQLKLC